MTNVLEEKAIVKKPFLHKSGTIYVCASTDRLSKNGNDASHQFMYFQVYLHHVHPQDGFVLCSYGCW